MRRYKLQSNLCDCGCGQEVKGYNCHTKKRIKFLAGHHTRLRYKQHKKHLPSKKGKLTTSVESDSLTLISEQIANLVFLRINLFFSGCQLEEIRKAKEMEKLTRFL